MPQKLFALILILFSACFINAQSKPDAKTTEQNEKLKKEAVTFLRETLVEVNTMRSLENRISFGAEMASLMWFHDEKEARTMYVGVTADFKRLIMAFDTQLNTIALAAAGPDEEYNGGGFLAEVTSKANIQRKFQKALEMRQQISLSLAEHEPDMALAFYHDSLALVTNPDIRERADDGDSYFEIQLMTQVAETNAGKAAQFAGKSLGKGVNYQHLELLKKIYAKDAEKGIEFAAAIVSRLKSDKLEGSEIWMISSLINFGEETTDKTTAGKAKKPVLTNQDMRDLAEVLAKAILDGEEDVDMGGGYTGVIEKYAPSRAAQIRARNRNRSRPSNSANAAANAMMTVANTVANAANSNSAGANPEAERRARAIEERIEAEKKAMDEVLSLGTRSLPKDERDKIVTQARKIISQSPGKEKKIMGLSLLASQVARVGDKELAAELMKEAESFVSPQPKNYQDFLFTWMLISGYAEVDTNRAFPMLTDTIFRLNDTISAFVKAAEFIDVQGEMVNDGEVQVGQFGGSMLRSLTKELKIAEPTLRSLAKADFAKTKAVTNTFDRTEVRVLAKMMLLRTILGGKETEKQDPNIGLVLN